MPQQPLQNVVIENARLIFRNFKGREQQYNQEGVRNFSVVIPDEQAVAMLEDGWNIKRLRDDEDGNRGDYHLPVAVSYKIRPPMIYMITSSGRTLLSEETVEILDEVEFSNVDLIIRPYEWGTRDKGGIKAYLQKMYATILEDALDLKYAAQMREDED